MRCVVFILAVLACVVSPLSAIDKAPEFASVKVTKENAAKLGFSAALVEKRKGEEFFVKVILPVKNRKEGKAIPPIVRVAYTERNRGAEKAAVTIFSEPIVSKEGGKFELCFYAQKSAVKHVYVTADYRGSGKLIAYDFRLGDLLADGIGKRSLAANLNLGTIKQIIVVDHETGETKRITQAAKLRKVEQLLSVIKEKGEIFESWVSISLVEVVLLCDDGRFHTLKFENNRLRRPIGGYGDEPEALRLVKILYGR